MRWCVSSYWPPSWLPFLPLSLGLGPFAVPVLPPEHEHSGGWRSRLVLDLIFCLYKRFMNVKLPQNRQEHDLPLMIFTLISPIPEPPLFQLLQLLLPPGYWGHNSPWFLLRLTHSRSSLKLGGNKDMPSKFPLQAICFSGNHFWQNFDEIRVCWVIYGAVKHTLNQSCSFFIF